jgi:short-subunit dehydrogenase
MPQNRYKAVLTGSTGGIGQAIARQLAPQCKHLILLGRNEAKLADLQRELAASGAKILVMPIRISSLRLWLNLPVASIY